MTREQLKEFVKRMTGTSGLSEEQLAEKINDAFDNKSKPFLPSNLDEAAEKIAWDIAPMYPDISWDTCFEKIKEGIKAGAEWMAGQEHQVVNLEKEIDLVWAKCNPIDEGMGVEVANIHIEQFDMIARHFYGLRNRALEEAARHVYESWNGGTMVDVRLDMVELGKVLNARKK